MNNNDWMLATARCGNTVVSELHKPNSMILSLVKIIDRSALAITSKDLKPFISKTEKTRFVKMFYLNESRLKEPKLVSLKNYPPIKK